MKVFRWVLMVGLVCGLSACCAPCEKPNLGSFEFHPDSEVWLDFAKQQTRLYKSSQNNEEVFFYADLFNGYEDALHGCESIGNCGLCCNEYSSAIMFTQLKSASEAFVFDLFLRKDFLQFTPDDNPADITDHLAISFNNTLTCDIFGLPNATFAGTITLNNRDFNNVLECELDSQFPAIEPNTPVKLYFNKADGIVGFEVTGTSENVIWSLAN